MEGSSPGVARSAIVTGVGFVYVTLAVLTGLSAALLFASSRNPDLATSDFWAIRHGPLITSIEGVFAVAMAVGGIGFLKQRRWARALLECISWLGLVYCVVGGIVLLNNVPRGSTAAPVVVLIVAFVGVVGLLIKALRSAAVRTVMG
jgi:hypothetical protein